MYKYTTGSIRYIWLFKIGYSADVQIDLDFSLLNINIRFSIKDIKCQHADTIDNFWSSHVCKKWIT